jgi:hypothetical protein
MDLKDLAMQSRCVYCGKEQYAPAVWRISLGEDPCVWCGKISKKMSVSDYKKAILKLNETN